MAKLVNYKLQIKYARKLVYQFDSHKLIYLFLFCLQRHGIASGNKLEKAGSFMNQSPFLTNWRHRFRKALVQNSLQSRFRNDFKVSAIQQTEKQEKKKIERN